MSQKKKYIIASIVIACILIIIIGVFICIYKKTDFTYQSITSTDGKFSVSLRSDMDYKVNAKSDPTFTLDFYSLKEEMYGYASTIEKQREVNLFDIVTEDRTSYLADKQNIRDDSGIQEIKIQDYKAYEYTLTYYDSSYGKDFYANIVWIETPHNLYCLNFEVVLQNIEKNKEIITNMKNSFVEV